MAKLQYGILVSGLVGLVGCLLPFALGVGFTAMFYERPGGGVISALVVAAAFATAIVVGGVAVARGLRRWHAIVAAVAFAVVVVQPQLFFDVFRHAIGAKLVGLATLAGLATSILSAIKPR